jgi:hypothetical protein
VKIYLDGDRNFPSLVGTGTEDYIGSGWGQGKFFGPYHGSLVADNKNDLYAFYRYHTVDPVYFYNDCRVTIQQMGSASMGKIRKMIAEKVPLQPVWIFDPKGQIEIIKAPEQILLLDLKSALDPNSSQISENTSVNFYRSDDVSATAYFYLDKPESGLPGLPPLELRMKDLKNRVFEKVNNEGK